MGFKQTAQHKNGKAQLPPDRPRPRPVRQRRRGQVGQVRRRRRLRRLGGGESGNSTCGSATPTPARPRTPRSASTWRRSTAWKSSPSPPTCRARSSATSRRAKTLNFCSRQGRGGAAYKAWRAGRQQPAADRPVLRPAGGRQAGPRRGAEGPARVRPLRRAPVEAAEPQGGAAGVRRLAGRLLEPLVPLPAAARRDRRARDPRRARRSAWNCSSSGSARSGTCARSTASRSTWSAIRASGRWATSKSASDYINHMCKAGLRGRGRLQPRRLAHGVAERLGDRSSSASSASSSTAPTSRACGWRASTAGPAGSAATGRWATGPTAGTS